MNSPKPWDIFCRVIDNYGDIGVCWRLAADLASRGQPVRLWVDDPTALSWMAPGAQQGGWPRVQVMAWDQMHDTALLQQLAPAPVWIEGFGCEPDAEWVAHRFNPARAGNTNRRTAPVWINLEYLSAEKFAQRAHGLPSPIQLGPAAGNTRFFYYPGFTPQTGGLLREPDLARRQAQFDRAAWLAAQGIDWRGEQLIALFCYEPPALAQLVARLQQGARPARLLVTAGRASAALRRLQEPSSRDTRATAGNSGPPLAVSFLPALAQTEFDHLLWSCDLNFVRGEDSLVRAIWAGKPFVWQIYPQVDDAHHAKLDAFLDAMGAPASWRQFHHAWNGIGAQQLPVLAFEAWANAVLQARAALSGQSDLTTRLLEFVEQALTRSQNPAERR